MAKANKKANPATDNYHSFTSIPSWAWRDFGAKGYGSGCDSGRAAAMAYLKYVSKRSDTYGGSLQHAVLDMAAQLCKAGEGTAEGDVIRGKIVGFFTLIDQYVDWAVKNSINNIEQITLDEILHYLGDAADGGTERRCAEYDWRRRSESARNAANARWSKRKAEARED